MMFQPRVKLEFIRRYCDPGKGWRVFVDIDPSEEGRTGGERKTDLARQRQIAMFKDAARVRRGLRKLGVTVGSRSDWHLQCGLPLLDGDRDIVAVHSRRRQYVIAEVEGVSSGQPEQKLYKAVGQAVMARQVIRSAKAGRERSMWSFMETQFPVSFVRRQHCVNWELQHSTLA
jgi:hypothetical protein